MLAKSAAVGAAAAGANPTLVTFQRIRTQLRRRPSLMMRNPLQSKAHQVRPELVRAITDLEHPQDNLEPALAHEAEARALPRIEPHPDAEDAGRSAMAGPESDGLAETSSEAARRRSTVREPAFASLRETPAEGQSEGPSSLGPASVSPEPVVSTMLGAI